MTVFNEKNGCILWFDVVKFSFGYRMMSCS